MGGKNFVLTNGRGVDHIIEMGGGENLYCSLNVVKLSDTISFIGLIAAINVLINTFQFVTRNVRICGNETRSR